MSFDDREGNLVEGEDMRRLTTTLASMEDAIQTLERRGVSLKVHANRIDPTTGRLPLFRVFLGNQEHWAANRQEVDKFVKEKTEELGTELVVNDDEANGSEESSTANRLKVTEYHEIKTINSGLKELESLSLNIESMIPIERTGTEESRYVLRRGEQEIGVEDLRSVVAAVRAAGEKGMHVTRFKGLGEMNAEELRETTLDPENRTLIQITMDNAAEADNMFRILMGDKVEPRREFIEKHALDVRELDV